MGCGSPEKKIVGANNASCPSRHRMSQFWKHFGDGRNPPWKRQERFSECLLNSECLLKQQSILTNSLYSLSLLCVSEKVFMVYFLSVFLYIRQMSTWWMRKSMKSGVDILVRAVREQGVLHFWNFCVSIVLRTGWEFSCSSSWYGLSWGRICPSHLRWCGWSWWFHGRLDSTRRLVGGACFGVVGVVLMMVNYEGGGVVVLWCLVSGGKGLIWMWVKWDKWKDGVFIVFCFSFLVDKKRSIHPDLPCKVVL